MASLEELGLAASCFNSEAFPFDRVDAEHVLCLHAVATLGATAEERGDARSKLMNFAVPFGMEAEEAVETAEEMLPNRRPTFVFLGASKLASEEAA